VLEHVHGYRGNDCRDNVHFTRDDQLVYFVAAVAIVQDVATGKQRFFTEHDDDIVALTLHPDGNTVATGQVGKHGAVCIWEADSGRLLHKIPKICERRVNCLSFSPDGSRLLAVGGDDHHMIKIVEWRRSGAPAIAEARAHGNDVLSVRFNPHVSRAFPSCTRSILTEIYLCHACSCQEIEDGNARAGADAGALHPGQPRRRAHALSVRGRARCLDRRSARRGGR
jgi:WD40 repeat protein